MFTRYLDQHRRNTPSSGKGTSNEILNKTGHSVGVNNASFSVEQGKCLL